jgi:hypothetical protein
MSWSVFPLWGGGNNLENILFISPVADLWDPVSPPQGAGMQIYNSFSGCRAPSALHGGWDTHLSVLRFPDPTSPPSETSIQLLLGRGTMTCLAALCWQWGDGVRVVALVSGVDSCSLQRPLIELNEGLMRRQRYSSIPWLRAGIWSVGAVEIWVWRGHLLYKAQIGVLKGA